MTMFLGFCSFTSDKLFLQTEVCQLRIYVCILETHTEKGLGLHWDPHLCNHCPANKDVPLT